MVLGNVDEKYYKLFSQFQFPDHLFFFSEMNLAELLQRTGFNIVHIYKYSLWPLLLVIGGIDKLIEKIKPLKNARQADEDKTGRHVPMILTKDDIRVSGAKKIVKNIYNYVYYVLRYKVGKVAPKQSRPQTLIVVARKIG